MILLPLAHGRHALLDPEDSYLLRWKWNINKYGHVRRNTRRSGGVSVTIYLHRAVYFSRLHPPSHEDMEIHHINGDKLDNRYENLVALPPDVHSRITRRVAAGLPAVQDPGDIPL